MIDKNGKLFGKINIIDLLIIIIIILALVFAGTKILGRDGSSKLTNAVGKTSTVRMTVFCDDVKEFVPDALHIGDPVEQYQSSIALGKLLEFSSEPAYTYQYDPQTGESVKVPEVNQIFMTAVIEATGVFNEWGLTVNDTTFVVGGGYFFNIGQTRVGVTIQSFEPAA